MADDITELVRLLREKPDITSHCAASCIEGFQRKAAKVSPDPVVVRLEREVEEWKLNVADAQGRIRELHEEITRLRGLLREACIGYEHNYDDASSDKRLRRVPIFHAWYEAAQAALEGKP